MKITIKGLEGRKTLTVKVRIDHLVEKALDENKTSEVKNTDLSSAFNTVYHQILLRKMKYYWIEGKENQLLFSYLKVRTQFRRKETKYSRIKKSANCSVVQCSRLSSLLYILYTNEVPRLKKLMEEKEWYVRTMKEPLTEYQDK